jgi:hypothetical protein
MGLVIEDQSILAGPVCMYHWEDRKHIKLLM